MKNLVILLVDDNESLVNSLKGSLEDEGYIVLTASDGIKAMDIIKSQPIDMVFLDIWLPEMDGIETLKAIKDYNSSIDVTMMTGHGTVSTAVQAVKKGAFDFLEKPFSFDTVMDIIKKIKEKQQISASTGKKNVKSSTEEDTLVLTGNDQSILKIKELIKKVSLSDNHVLLQGEVGTGKDFVARIIHSSSRRRTLPLLKFNVAFYILKELEIELFGLQKRKDQSYSKNSVIYNAKDSTIFLDSADLLPIKMQKRLAKILTMPKQKGSNVRIIAAATEDIDKGEEERKLHKVLQDCFTYKIDMPALRNRRGDIPLLLDMFVEYFCRDYGFRKKHLEDDALETLVNYDWPGNVKELKNLVEKLVVSVPTKNISALDIPLSMRDEMQYSMARYYERYKSMGEAEAAWRKNYLLYFLRKSGRDIKITSDKIGVKENKLKKYIKEYGIILAKEKKTDKKFQKTLKRSMVLSGTGLHSGDKTGLILTPLPPDSGIVFGNISSGDTIPADIDFVVSTNYATILQNTNAVARTIEHFMAALHAYRITNLMIKINNEVPIMDGSAVDFCRIIEDAGIEEQDELCEDFVVNDQYILGEVKKNSKFITVEPSDKFSIHYILRYPKPVGHQEYTFVMDDEEAFKKEIAPARTFGFLKDIEALEKKGLASGGRLNNFILIDDEKIVNTDLRFPDEFVRHKILDMLGDLYLLGRPIRGKITANMTGHSENAELVRMFREKMQV